MTDLSQIQVFGAWISIFLTLCILSFLYEDNPVYKLCEHLFLGVSIGIGVVETYFAVFKPNLLDKLFFAEGWDIHRMTYFIPLAMVVMLFFKLSPKRAWVARVPIAFIVAAYAGVKMTGEANANLMTQVARSMPDLAQSWNDHGLWSWKADGAGVVSDVLLVAGLCACLIHFYFSEVPRAAKDWGGKAAAAAFLVVGISGFVYLDPVQVEGTGVRAFLAALLGICGAIPFLAFSKFKPWISRFGVLVLMLSFGASFGYTVMGRISLAIGRAQEMLGLDRPAEQVAQIHPRIASLIGIVLVVGYLVFWRLRGARDDSGKTAA